MKRRKRAREKSINGVLKDKKKGKIQRKVHHQGSEGQKEGKDPEKKSINGVLKDKKEGKTQRKVHHRGSEGQKEGKEPEKNLHKNSEGFFNAQHGCL
ncbi:hypothetical protein AM592_11120 [Bacillus gobiensis]|uniref:Uncharacterized protein n=1 Tax=Bacillus gobiensis TaxID=1441095 RepID=A0A0M3RB22_9BACI|nr:hypothetical protein AM592_11120 [Bacillus gobiensis]